MGEDFSTMLCFRKENAIEGLIITQLSGWYPFIHRHHASLLFVFVLHCWRRDHTNKKHFGIHVPPFSSPQPVSNKLVGLVGYSDIGWNRPGERHFVLHVLFATGKALRHE